MRLQAKAHNPAPKKINKFNLKDFKLSKRKILLLVLSVVFLLVSASQLERLHSQGTIFGYKVRTVKTSSAKARQKNSGSVVNAKVSDKNEKSVACDTFPVDKVSRIVGAEVERVSGFAKDQTDPYLISNCIYVAKGSDSRRLSTSMLLRDMRDVETSKKTFTSISGSRKGEEIKGLGDSAYFSTSSNQLTVRKDKRLITVTVTGSDNTKDMAVQISKLAL